MGISSLLFLHPADHLFPDIMIDLFRNRQKNLFFIVRDIQKHHLVHTRIRLIHLLDDPPGGLRENIMHAPPVLIVVHHGDQAHPLQAA